MDEKEHLEWAKQRAYAYCDIGQFQEAFQSLVSDLNKHPAFANEGTQTSISLGVVQLMKGRLNTVEAMRHFRLVAK
jgi:soluble cytochrome b562